MHGKRQMEKFLPFLDTRRDICHHPVVEVSPSFPACTSTRHLAYIAHYLTLPTRNPHTIITMKLRKGGYLDREIAVRSKDTAHM